eukprot:TRINITY_DN18282_c0_g1_i1.p1 TRINITY_DN18282_c0_g1~~TRINITY_DN18282_c0_g1_i1.p1  ORF type:complete len:280 (-),score=32.00 TRINITY_DN18282_c0_g1_i1:176-1015(-)
MNSPTKTKTILYVFLFCFVNIFFLSILLNHSSSTISDREDSSPNRHILLFLGIFTTAAKEQRRMLIRNTYMKYKSPSVEVNFIVCSSAENETNVRNKLSDEIDNFKDILIIDCYENMNDGKTFDFFAHMVNNYSTSPDFVMKGDDDAYYHLPNLETRTSTFPKTGVFFGRRFGVGNSFFFSGMGYMLSFDLVRWIATDGYPASDKKGPEDVLVTKWINRCRLVTSYLCEEYEIYTTPFKNLIFWVHDLTLSTLVVHYLKTDEDFLRVSSFFDEYLQQKV